MADAATPVEFLIVQADAADSRVTREAFEYYEFRNGAHITENADVALTTLMRAASSTGSPAAWLVMLDLDLPDAGGRDLLRRLRADPRTAEVPVILLVRSSAQERLLRAEDLPVQGYARKPADFDAVACAVRCIDSLSVAAWRGTGL
ncbi:response regulator [Actinoplanes sp. NBC_00393]|uniref:response regulator n=1 Tax=Actinoplanes sp. NBC_00393 TaxID=2975953 RepID=UPI002E21F978